MIETARRFDRGALADQISHLPRRGKVAFAASCAQRLFPQYLRYLEVAEGPVTEAYAQALETAWQIAASDLVDAASVKALVDRCMAALPTEDDAEATGVPYAEDAAAAVLYALRTALTDKAQEAVWAANRVYDALDHHVINALGIDINLAGSEEKVLGHGLIQAELARQFHDLQALQAGVDAPVLRRRAQAESAGLFKLET